MLVDLSVKQFLNKVSSCDPIPGGGSIAALNAAIAAALSAMVAGVTIGKKNYEKHEELMERIRGLAMVKQGEFIQYVDCDAEAYHQVFACYKMPKTTDEEKQYRHQAIQESTRYAALIPMQVARNAYELMSLIKEVAHYGNKNL